VERLVVRRGGGSITPLEVSPDGRRVAYYEWGAEKRSTLVIVDLATGDATELLLGAGLSATWSPDGHRLVTSGFALRNSVTIVDLRDSTEVAVELRCDTACSLQAERTVFSPDGSSIAFTDDFGDALWIAGLTDGHATRVAQGVTRTLGWTEDGIYYLVEDAGPQGASSPVIYRVAPEGGAPQLFARLPEDCNIEDVSLSIDALTAVCGVIDWKPDVHIVEHFDRTVRR
jgi:Tol biopolymer transport system component